MISLERLSHSAHLKYIFSSFLSVSSRNASHRQRYACRSPSEWARGGGGNGADTAVFPRPSPSIWHSSRPNGEVGDDCEFGSVEEDGDEDAGRPPTKWRRVPHSVTQRYWKRREGVVRRSCASRGSVTQVTRASYDGRAAVPSINREGVTQTSCRVTATQSIIKVTEPSACFGHRGVTAFTERRVTGVLGHNPILIFMTTTLLTWQLI